MCCVFSVNDVLLSHMITFLNDKVLPFFYRIVSFVSHYFCVITVASLDGKLIYHVICSINRLLPKLLFHG